jgi:hypothetical protein
MRGAGRDILIFHAKIKCCCWEATVQEIPQSHNGILVTVRGRRQTIYVGGLCRRSA